MTDTAAGCPSALTDPTDRTDPAPSGAVDRVARRRRPSPFTPIRQERFLDALARTASVAVAATEAGVARPQLYRLRHADPVFLARWDAVMLQVWDELEGTLLNRALHGHSEAGDSPDAARQADTGLMLALYRARPARRLAAGSARSSTGTLPDYATARRRVEDKLDLMAERLAHPLPPGLATREAAAGPGKPESQPEPQPESEPEFEPELEPEPGA